MTPGGGERRPNRLIKEKSPYLLQHAHNPVDWYPWGDDAFEKARREDRPIFLSIGYSTCHWCHVMERESFEDPEVARLLNDTFVSIKVDREERPDIDALYMTVCQMMTGGGGWPLTIIMTPEKEPFFAATYIPKESRFGRVGMLDLVPQIKEIWTQRRREVQDSAGQILKALQQISHGAPGEEIGEATLGAAFEQLTKVFDEREGGFGTSPKFPSPHNLLFLLRYWRRTGEEKALHMVERTLQAMGRGGIYDHVGFGFHRYSTDRGWLLPHFEKMLYDQAMLALAYTEGFQATGREEYRQKAREIFTYVLRDMASPEGGFYSAEDAESQGVEGKFYLWREEEIRGHLTEREAELVIYAYNIERGGNFLEEATGRRTGRNILHMDRSMEEIARDLGIPEEDLRQALDGARRKLLAAREGRVRPHRDDKVLVDWNGLMMAALARGGQVFDEPLYTQAARRAADFILDRMRTPEGRLFHRFRQGEAAIPAHLDDYAFLIWGLMELYEASFQVSYLREALTLNRDMLDHFWDRERGGFYFTAEDAGDLPVRRKEIHDGAVPSGNSVAMLNLLRLARMTGDAGLEERASEMGRAFSNTVKRSPTAHTHLLSAVDFALGPAQEVVIAGEAGAEDTRAMLGALRSRFIPSKVVLLRPEEGEGSQGITQIAQFTKPLTSIGGRATAYICRDYRCELPTTEVDKMLEMLARNTPGHPDASR